LTKNLFRLETAWFNTITDVPINVLNTSVHAQAIVAKIVNKQQTKDQIVHYPALSEDGKNICPLFFKLAVAEDTTTITIVPLVSGNSLIGIAIAINNINTGHRIRFARYITQSIGGNDFQCPLEKINRG
jgi:hypothetical protein